MGMDEHSQSVTQAAARAGVTPQAWVDRMAATFADYWRRLHCSHDDWIRTTEPRHAGAVAALLERIRQRHPADLFEAEYEGLYCTGCEEFKTGAQIVDGRCIEHPTLELIPTKERNHFFRLSAYRDAVLERIRSGSFAVEPEIRRNEVVRLLEAGLQDISISRQRQPWGIPFPGDAQQTVYVWFDALINYLSATGFPDPGYERLWPADLHVIGKGITRFHCVIWPAMLLAAELAPPRRWRSGRAGGRWPTGARWTLTASRTARRSGWISRGAPTATSRRPHPGSSRRRARTPSSIKCSPASPAPSPSSPSSASRSCRPPPRPCGRCSGPPRPRRPPGRSSRCTSQMSPASMWPAGRSRSRRFFFPSPG